MTGVSHCCPWPVNVSSSNPIAPEVYYRNKALLSGPAAHETFFGLRENPFGLTPDPRYLYRTRHAHDTLRQLTRAILSRRGLILLSGEVGTGKTTLLNSALHFFKGNPTLREKTRTVVLVHPTLTREEFVEAVLAGFHVPPSSSRSPRRLQLLFEMLVDLHRKGGTAILAIDEAQHLSPDLLDEIRTLLMMRGGGEELLQVVLCGQPEFEEKVSRSSLATRPPSMVVRCFTAPLTLRDTRDYIEHRLKVACAKCGPLFGEDAIQAIHHFSRGIPRIVNLLCAHALANAALRGIPLVSAKMVEEAAEKMPFADRHSRGSRPRGPHSGNGASVDGSAAPPGNGTESQSEVMARAAVPRIAVEEFLRERKMPPFVIRSADRILATRVSLTLRSWSWQLDRWWSATFDQKKHRPLLRNMAFAGALLLVAAQGTFTITTVPWPWQHVLRTTCGFVGLLLLDISLGLTAYILYDRRAHRYLPQKSAGVSYKRLLGAGS
jgi:general secretion pathway protein A